MKRTILVVGLVLSVALATLIMSERPAEAGKVSIQMLDVEQQWAETVSSASSSTTSATGYLLSYSVAAYGADVLYTVHFTSGTDVVKTDGESRPSPFPQISSSTVRTVRSGDSVSEKIMTMIKDPSIVVHELDTSATVQVILSYGVPGAK